MSVFADSSALVKLYADERDADVVRVIEVFVVSAVARVEVPAALWRKVRTSHLSSEHAAVLVAEFEADWYGQEADGQRLLPVRTSVQLLETAARLAAVHALRAYDAVQLASALAARAAASEVATLACFDAHLRTAAAAEGFALLPST